MEIEPSQNFNRDESKAFLATRSFDLNSKSNFLCERFENVKANVYGCRRKRRREKEKEREGRRERKRMRTREKAPEGLDIAIPDSGKRMREEE